MQAGQGIGLQRLWLLMKMSLISVLRRFYGIGLAWHPSAQNRNLRAAGFCYDIGWGRGLFSVFTESRVSVFAEKQAEVFTALPGLVFDSVLLCQKLICKATCRGKFSSSNIFFMCLESKEVFHPKQQAHDLLLFHGRVVVQELLNAVPSFQVVEKDFDGHPGFGENRCAALNLRGNGDDISDHGIRIGNW